MENRKYLPTLNELIDRLSIHQLKEVFIPENKENYAKENSISMILRKEQILIGINRLDVTKDILELVNKS